MDDDGWIVKGAPKKKKNPAPLPSTYYRTATSANTPKAATAKQTKSSQTAHVPNVNVKPTFDHLHDNEEYRYDKSQLEWMMPAEVFEKIVEKFPALKKLEYTDRNSRWHFMHQAEQAHWYYTDDLPQLLPDLYLPPIRNVDFFAALIQSLVVAYNLHPHYSPLRYKDEWQYWQKNCRVGSIALVRQHPETRVWENLLVKNNNPWFYQLNSTWPGGKAELNDVTFWDLACREMKEELSLDVSGDKSRVIGVIEGDRAISFVLPIAYDDPRLSALIEQKKEIHSYFWTPVDMDIHTVKLPAKEYRDTSTSVQHPKEDPPYICMAWSMKESFKKLQHIDSFETKQDQDAIDQWLERDPRILE